MFSSLFSNFPIFLKLKIKERGNLFVKQKNKEDFFFVIIRHFHFHTKKYLLSLQHSFQNKKVNELPLSLNMKLPKSFLFVKCKTQIKRHSTKCKFSYSILISRFLLIYHFSFKNPKNTIKIYKKPIFTLEASTFHKKN